MEGKIIVGYPCIGKTSIAGENNVIDLDSSTFKNEQGIRHENWTEIYINVAWSLAKQGYTVFVSSHFLVTNELKRRHLPFSIICPSLDLYEDWICRALSRFEKSSSEKDLLAFHRIRDYYKTDIEALINMEGVTRTIIHSTDYNLTDLI